MGWYWSTGLWIRKELSRDQRLVFSELRGSSHASSGIFTEGSNYPDEETPDEPNSIRPGVSFHLRTRTLLKNHPLEVEEFQEV